MIMCDMHWYDVTKKMRSTAGGNRLGECAWIEKGLRDKLLFHFTINPCGFLEQKKVLCKQK